MTRRVHRELEYDATAAEVFAMLANPEFREEVCRAIGVLSVDVDIKPREGEGMEVTLTQVQPTSGIPSFAKKFVGETTTVVQHEVWTSSRHADITVTIPGKPGEMTGTADLSEAAGRTTERVEMAVKVRIPVVGGKIEELIAGLLGKALDAEHRTGQERLSR